MTVLIVGAGAAGLTAAYTLFQEGITDFQILEASNRLGGRLKKIELDGFASFPIDLGAEWIHVEPTVLEDISQNDTILDSVETVLHIPEEYLVWQGPERGFGLNYMDFATEEDLTDHLFVNYSWFDFFNDTIAVPQVRDSIVFDCAVTVIDYSSKEDVVTAACQNGETFLGSHIMVTAPLQILQDGDIEFVPPLPDSHVEALLNISMPAGFKIFFQFQEDFYPDMFEMDSELDPLGLLFYDETFGQASQEGEHVLGVFVSDDAAEEATEWEDADAVLIHNTLAKLDEMLDGNATNYFIHAVVQNWQTEPFIRGTYSHYSSWQDIDQLKVPITTSSGGEREVLWLAGEALPATYTEYGTSMAHGAALSGKETAQWIMETMKRESGGSETKEEDTKVDTSSASRIQSNCLSIAAIVMASL